MNIPLLGECALDPVYDCLASAPVELPILGGNKCRFLLEGYIEDSAKPEIDGAIASFLSASFETLNAAAPHIYQYYQDIRTICTPDDDFPLIHSSSDVWAHVQFGKEAYVSRRTKDGAVYISLECNCDWEPEHGLQIVFKDGHVVNKIGPYDGHLTNSDAYANATYENVVYKALA